MRIAFGFPPQLCAGHLCGNRFGCGQRLELEQLTAVTDEGRLVGFVCADCDGRR